MIRAYWGFRTALAWTLAFVSFLAFAATNTNYLNPGNIYALIQTFAVLALVATGLALVMIAGEFDLSIAGVVPLSALVAVKVGETSGVGVGVIAALLAALAVGLVNGWLTATFAIPSLAVTVGTLVLTTGIGFAIAGSAVVTLTDFGPGFALDQPILGVLSLRAILQVALAVAVAVLMTWTWLGISTHAVGSDPARASASGVSVPRALLVLFAISGLFAGVAGSLQGVSLASGSAGPNEAILLQSVTAAIIGGVSVAGGKGNIWGVLGGAMLLAVVSNGLSLQGTSSAVVQLINGAILLGVVILDGPLTCVIQGALETSRTVPEPSSTARITEREALP